MDDNGKGDDIGLDDSGIDSDQISNSQVSQSRKMCSLKCSRISFIIISDFSQL